MEPNYCRFKSLNKQGSYGRTKKLPEAEQAEPVAAPCSDLISGIWVASNWFLWALTWHDPDSVCMVHDPISEVGRWDQVWHGLSCPISLGILPLLFREFLPIWGLVKDWVVVLAVPTTCFSRTRYNTCKMHKEASLTRVSENISQKRSNDLN